jgi:hypothetical protein
MMMEGLPFLVALALAMAASMALKSWPSIVTVFQLGEDQRNADEDKGRHEVRKRQYRDTASDSQDTWCTPQP